MSILDRYLIKIVLLNVVLVLLILVALDRLFAFIRRLDDLGKGSYEIDQLLIDIALRIPGSFYEMTSTAALLGALLGLGALASNSELIVVRSIGVSLPRLVRPLLLAGALLAIAVFSLGEWVVAPSEEYATRQHLKAVSTNLSIKGVSGLWLREGELFINIERVLPNFNLRGVTIYRYQGSSPVQLLRAESASYHETEGWQLKRVQTHRFVNGRLLIEKSALLQRASLLNPEILRALSLQPEMLSTLELYENVRYLKRNQLRSTEYEQAFWSKFSVPISSVVMLITALPFLLGSLRSSGIGQRVFVGSLIGIGFLLLSKISSQLGSVIGAHSAIGAFLPIVLFTFISFSGLRRIV